MGAVNKGLSAFKNLCAHADEIVMRADANRCRANSASLSDAERAEASKRADAYQALWVFIQTTFAMLPEEVQPTAAFILLVGSDAFAKCTPVSAQWQEWSTCKMVEKVVDVDQLQRLCSAAPEFSDLVATAQDDSEILGAEPPAGGAELEDD